MTYIPCPPGFDLAATLDCGQCFRWEQREGLWQGVAFGRELALRQVGDRLELFCEAQDAPLWAAYFDLERDYDAILGEAAERYPVLRQALAVAGGIRILRQEPWEALCSFIVSQNNNIKRIRGLVKRLCEAFGTPLGEGNFAFPTAEQLAGATEEELRAMGLGYRAPYLLDAARRVACGRLDLRALEQLPLEEAETALREVHGVGPKVAQCALLYGLHRLDAFPVDVWMKRAMARYLPGCAPKDLGPCAGAVQQVLFHSIRMEEGAAGKL